MANIQHVLTETVGGIAFLTVVALGMVLMIASAMMRRGSRAAASAERSTGPRQST